MWHLSKLRRYGVTLNGLVTPYGVFHYSWGAPKMSFRGILFSRMESPYLIMWHILFSRVETTYLSM